MHAIKWSDVAGQLKGEVRRQGPKLLALGIATGLELAMRRRLRRQAPKLLALAIGTGAEMIRQRQSSRPTSGRRARSAWKLLLVTGLAATAVLMLNRR